MLTKISRSKLDNILEDIGIIKSPYYEKTHEYEIKNAYEGSIAIELTERPYHKILNSMSSCLLELSKKWLLFPRYAYLGSDDSIKTTSIPVSPKETDAILWSTEDQELIDTVISFHATMGGNLGWDLYISDLEGKYLILISHHEYLLIESSHKKHLETIGVALEQKHINLENNI